MPIELSKLNAARTVSVEYDGDVFTVTYRTDAISPAALTAKARARKVEAAERNSLSRENGGSDESAEDTMIRQAEQNANDLVEILESWDVTDGGKPLPITVENLMLLSPLALQHISAAISDDFTPKAKNSRR
jgi:hypothetical protein